MKTWNDFYLSVKNKDYALKLKQFIDDEYANYVCYPPKEKMFNAFKFTPVSEIKVVIFGQDPYHEPNQAMGLCFSVSDEVKMPPSLLNIYKELESEYDFQMDYAKKDLTYLAKQGILMLNPILSVRKGQPLSHKNQEYRLFFKDLLAFLNDLDQPIVFMLWGGQARLYAKALNNPKHLILECNHPSPLSANRGGWFGNNHFRLCNEFLTHNGLEPIKWQNN